MTAEQIDQRRASEHRLTFEQYLALDAVNWSTLRELGQSPRHYRHRLRAARPDTDRLAIGRAVHTAVFEPDRFPLDYVVWTGKARRGTHWTAFTDANIGRTILPRADYERCLAVRDAVRVDRNVRAYLETGLPEHTVRWTDEVTGIACKARLDWVSSSRPAIGDLKTTRSTDSRLFSSQTARLDWHTQLAWYRDGFYAATGECLPTVLFAVEIGEPHDTAVFVVNDDMLYAGTERYRELLNRLKTCRETDTWPGRYAEEQTIVLPAWAYPETDDVDGLGLVIGDKED